MRFTLRIPVAAAGAVTAPRAHEVLTRMTPAEKIQLVHGSGGSDYVGYIPPIPRLCVPALSRLDDLVPRILTQAGGPRLRAHDRRARNVPGHGR